MRDITVRYPAPNDCAPLYAKYTNKTRPQPALLELDLENAVLRCRTVWKAEGSVPARVCYGHVHYWPVPSEISAVSCRSLLDAVLPKARRAVAGYSSDGPSDRHIALLTDDAIAALYDIDCECERVCAAEV